MRKILLMISCLFCSLSSAWADDSIEAAATGNIVFEKTPELIMQDETLTIHKSANKNIWDERVSIDVDFHFKNISNHDMTRKIAFVLPPVQCRMEINSAWQGLDFKNAGDQHQALSDFTTDVDGQPQKMTSRITATLNKKDITSLLNKLNIPLNPCNIQVTSQGQPDPRYSANLKKYHLLAQTNEAAWDENIYFEWMQTFPAGKIIHIQHHYTAPVGGSVLSPRNLSELNQEFTNNKPPYTPLWNRDPDSLQQTNSQLVSNQVNPETGKMNPRFCVAPKWVLYNLLTGANWNHGIGLFKLVIQDDADAPFAVNAFYQANNDVHITKEANTMTFTLQHFIPTQNLLVQFLSLPQTADDLKACGDQQ